MIFKQLKQGIDDVFAIGNSLTQINNLKLDATNITGYATALKGLTVKQAELVLSTKGLTVAQQQAILAEAELLGVTGTLTTAELNAILVNKKRNKDQAEALLIKTGLITAETSEATATNVVTAAKLKELVQTKALTQAEADLIAAKAGVTLANQKESASFLAGVGSKIKGLGSGLKSAGTGVLALAKAHPVIAAITTALTIGTVAIGIYKKKQEEAAEAIREAYENAKTAIEEVNSTFKNTESTTKQIAEEYAELAQGVNLLSNENKKLSTEKYERFLELSNQLSTLYPSLTKNYDENGNAILDLSGDVDTIIGSLDDLIERQRALANQEIVEQMPDLFAGYTNNVADFKEQLDEAEKAKEAVQSAYDTISKYGIYTAFDINGNAKDANGDPVALKLGQYISLLETLGITAKQVNLKDSMGQIIGYKLELEDGSDIPNISGIHDAYVSQFNKTIDDVKYAKMQLDSETSSINQYLNTWLQTEFSYNQIETDGLQKAIQETLFNFDWSSLPEGIDKNDWESVSEYLRRNVLFSINNIDNADVSQALADIYTGALTSGELLNAISKVQEYFGEEHPISVALEPKVSDVEPLINNVKDKLQGTEFDDKVGELSLDDLKIASELDVPLDSIESWEELLALIQKVKDETSDNKSYDSFASIFNSSDFSEQKQSLLDLAKAGELTNKALSSDDYTDFIDKLGEIGISAEEAKTEILSLLDATEKLSGASKSISGLENAYNEFKEKGYVLAETIESIPDVFRELETYDFDVFENIIGNPKNVEQMQGAFNDLVTAYISEMAVLSDVSEAEAQRFISNLEEMGVTNADTVVNSVLALNDSMKATAKEAESTAQEINEFLVNVKGKAASATNDLTNCTWSEINALIEEGNKFGFSTNKIEEFAMKKIWANRNSINTSEDVKQLLAVAKACGLAIGYISTFNASKQLINGAGLLANNSTFATDALLKGLDLGTSKANILNNLLKQIEAEYSFETPEVEWSAPTSSSNKNSSSSSSSKEAEKTVETFDWIEKLIERIQSRIAKLEKTASSTYKSWAERNKALLKQLSEVNTEINAQQKAYDTYMVKANSVGLSEHYKQLVQNGGYSIEDISDDTLKEKISAYEEWYNKAMDCSDAIDDLKNNILELTTTQFENVFNEYEDSLSGYKHQVEMLQTYIDQTEAKGYVVSGNYYKQLIETEKLNIKMLQDEYAKLKDSLQLSVDTGKIVAYSDAWYDMVDNIRNVQKSIEDANTSLIDYQTTLRELEWESFDRFMDKISNIKDESDFLIELMSDKDMFNEDGITDEGQATLGLHAINYNVYLSKAEEYAKKLKDINEEIANDPNNQTLLKRRQELLELQQEAILASKDEQQAMKDLISEGYDVFIDSLQKIIDKRKEMLSQMKDIYDYEKSISEQTKEISKIEKMLKAYEGDNSEEAKKKVQQYKVSLEEAKSNLEQTEFDRYIQEQEKMLDSIYD